MKAKFFKMAALVLGGSTLFNGCLGDFWGGLWNTGWPSDNRVLNIAIDILNEELFG